MDARAWATCRPRSLAGSRVGRPAIQPSGLLGVGCPRLDGRQDRARRAAGHLTGRWSGAFLPDLVERTVFESYASPARTARVRTHPAPLPGAAREPLVVTTLAERGVAGPRPAENSGIGRVPLDLELSLLRAALLLAATLWPVLNEHVLIGIVGAGALMVAAGWVVDQGIPRWSADRRQRHYGEICAHVAAHQAGSPARDELAWALHQVLQRRCRHEREPAQAPFIPRTQGATVGVLAVAGTGMLILSVL